MPGPESLLEIVRHEREQSARVEAELDEAEKGRLGIDGYKVEYGNDAPGGCMPVRISSPDGPVSAGWICFDRRAPHRRCDFCRGWSVAQCDYPTGGSCPKCKGRKKRGGGQCHACAGTGYAMCNKRVCMACRAHKDPDEDYCPDHREQAGFAPLVWRERCFWTDQADTVVRRECLHKGCAQVLQFGERVLYFPGRNRAMCEACGEQYLKVAV